MNPVEPGNRQVLFPARASFLIDHHFPGEDPAFKGGF